MEFKFRNINDAFYGLVSGINSGKIPTTVRASRYGEVMMIEEPVLVTYDRPRERVLFNQARDANPFFHLFESLWMLAGRNDVAPLAKYNGKIAEIASDDGKTFNGAYGYRWRHSNMDYEDRVMRRDGTDQLKIIVDQLKNKPESRRAVLQMWNVEDDLLKIDSSKDVCCNTHVYFSVELGDCKQCDGQGEYPQPENADYEWQDVLLCPKCNGKPHDVPRYLNMTVCNRSNDLIWGMLGANVVHFSILQEYMAACIGLEVGVYNQFTNNLHVYTDNWKPEEWLKDYEDRDMHSSPIYNYADVDDIIYLVRCPEAFDQECAKFIDNDAWDRDWDEPFLQEVAAPMCWVFELHKRRDYFDSLRATECIKSDDWRIAAVNWIEKREQNWEKKNGVQAGVK